MRVIDESCQTGAGRDPAGGVEKRSGISAGGDFESRIETCSLQSSDKGSHLSSEKGSDMLWPHATTGIGHADDRHLNSCRVVQTRDTRSGQQQAGRVWATPPRSQETGVLRTLPRFLSALGGTCAALVLPLFASLTLAGCEPAPTGDGNLATPTPQPTATPTPIPVLDVDYRVTAMAVADGDSQELDIDGDGRTDNGLSNALKEMGSFLSARIKAQLKELYEEGTLTEEQYRALTASVTAAIQAIFNVETINKALAQALESTPWLESIESTGPGTIGLGYFLGEVHDDGYLTTASLGALTGTYKVEFLEIDANGGPFTVNLAIAAGGETVEFSVDLEDCRTLHIYAKDQPLRGAKMGGGVSVAELEEFVNDVLSKLGLLPFFDKQELEDLQNDLNDLLTEMADIELSNGADAVSVSLIYDAETASILGEAEPEY